MGADSRGSEGVVRSLRAQDPLQGAPGGVFARCPGGGLAPGEGPVGQAVVGGVRGGVLDRDIWAGRAATGQIIDILDGRDAAEVRRWAPVPAAMVDRFRRGGLCGPPRGLPQGHRVAARRRRLGG